MRVWAAEGGLGGAAAGAGGAEWGCEQVLEKRQGGTSDGGPVLELEVWGDEDRAAAGEEGAAGAGARAGAGAAPPARKSERRPFADHGGHASTVWDVRFSRHEAVEDEATTRMATASADGTVRVWRAAFEAGSSGRRPAFAPEAVVLAGFRPRRRRSNGGGGNDDSDSDPDDDDESRADVLSVDWSTRGWLATGDARNALRVFEPPGRGEGWRLAADAPHPLDVNCVRWHPTDATLAATACDDGRVRLWRLVAD